MRTYRVQLDCGAGKEVERMLPDDPQEAREYAEGMAERNAAWRESQWYAASNGDSFMLDHDGRAAS